MCKFQGGASGARSAGSRLISRVLRTGNRTQPAPETCTCPLPQMVEKNEYMYKKLKNIIKQDNLCKENPFFFTE